MTREEALKHTIAEQQKQIYNLYIRIEQLNEILKRRDREQQKNI